MILSVLEVQRQHIADLICEVITNAKMKNIREIHLVDNADRLLSPLAGAFLKKNNNKSCNHLLDVIRLDKESVSNAIQKCVKWEQKVTEISDGLKVSFRCDNIANVKADAIVCPNDQKLSCSTGPAKHIADSVGIWYKWTCKEAARRRTLHGSDVFSIYTLTHGIIINVIVPRLRSSLRKTRMSENEAYKDLLERSYEKGINEAKICGASSLALYPLGAGK